MVIAILRAAAEQFVRNPIGFLFMAMLYAVLLYIAAVVVVEVTWPALWAQFWPFD